MTARGIHSCCPEAATVNVTQNIIQVDGSQVIHHTDYFTGADAVDNVLTLTYVPHSANSVFVFLNSGHQGRGTTLDYTVIYDQIRLKFTPADDDVIRVQYMAVTDPSDNSSTLTNVFTPVGSIVSYAGATAPTGWLSMSGVEPSGTVLESAYPELYAFLTINLDLTVGGVDTSGELAAEDRKYVLKELTDSHYSGGVLVTMGSIIKRDEV